MNVNTSDCLTLLDTSDLNCISMSCVLFKFTCICPYQWNSGSSGTPANAGIDMTPEYATCEPPANICASNNLALDVSVFSKYIL